MNDNFLILTGQEEFVNPHSGEVEYENCLFNHPSAFLPLLPPQPSGGVWQMALTGGGQARPSPARDGQYFENPASIFFL